MPELTPERWASMPFDSRMDLFWKAHNDCRILDDCGGYIAPPPPWVSPWRDFVLCLRLPNDFSPKSAHPSVSLSGFNSCSSETRVILFRFVVESLLALRTIRECFKREHCKSEATIIWVIDCIDRYETFLDVLELRLIVEIPYDAREK